MTKEESRRLTEDEKVERKVRKRVREQKAFYQHLGFYLLFCVFFVALNLFSSPDYFWAFWPIMGWGIGVASHGLSVFGAGFGKNWEERKVRELMLQEQHGLSADEVRQLLRDELRTERTPPPNASEWERMRHRLENLEAIVTSKDWDQLHDFEPSSDLLSDSSSTEDPEADPSQQAARLSRRIR